MNLTFSCTIEHRSGYVNTLPKPLAELDHFVWRERVEKFTEGRVVVDLLQLLAKLISTPFVFDVRLQPLAYALGCPPQVGFEDLADVHTRRNAKRIKDDVD